jgi:glycosyltransferase involved in cell wall biosynthesis
MSKVKKLAIITTHPIQYYAPIFKLLHQRGNIGIKVFYTWGEKALNKHDPGFNKTIAWDIPLLDGYPYEWVQNTSADAGTHRFKGIVNPGLIKQVEAWQPDAVLIYGWAYHSHLKAMRHFKNKVPVLFRGDSTLLDETGGLKATLKSVFLKWVYKHVDSALYVGANNKAYFKKYGLKESQLTFAPHAIDNDRFAADREEEAVLQRKQLGIGDDEILILFAGKLESKKSPLLLLDSFIALNNDRTHLLFLGNGALENDLKAKKGDLKNVHFMDFQNQSVIPVIYQGCDLFCLPSKGPGETWGLAVNEAMACGRAVLVSNKVGCAIDLVEDDYNGAIFKSGEIDNLTYFLNKLTQSKAVLHEYGENSKVVIKQWNFLKIAEAIEHKLNEKI